MFPLYDPILKPDLPILDISDPAAQGLIAAYVVSERSGVVLRDVAGGNDLTVAGGGMGGLSLYGPALTMDGTTTYATRTGFAGISTLNSPMSLEIWLRGSSWASDPNVISLDDGVSGAVQIIPRTTATNVYKFGGVLLATSPTILSLNTYHHLVYTWDGTTNCLYIDGILAATSTTAHQTGAASILKVGAWTSSQQLLSGQVAGAFAYNRAIIANEVIDRRDAPWRPYQGGAVNVYATARSGVPGAYFRMLQQMGGA